MDYTKQLIIIGGGASIVEGIELGLWDKIKNKFTLACNFGYKYLDATAVVFFDPEFYNGYQGQFKDKWHDADEKKLEHIKALDSLPLLLGRKTKNLQTLRPNTIIFNGSNDYHNHSSIKLNKVYSRNLCGVFALTLGINLLDAGEIFLLGYDSGAPAWKDLHTPLTHFAQVVDPDCVKHRGMGGVGNRPLGYYKENNETRDFKPFKENAKIQIYNVSLKSKIPDKIFPKISYKTFFEKLNPNENYNQAELREQIKETIKKLKGN